MSPLRSCEALPLGNMYGRMDDFALSLQDLFVLLDLLGGADPLIVNHFDNTARWFDRLIAAGKRRLSRFHE